MAVLQDLVKGYVEAMLWAEYDDNDTPLDENYSFDDLAPETLEKIQKVCERFAELTKDVNYQWVRETPYSNAELAGYDLWLTSRSHGVGFWESDRWKVDGEEIEGEENVLCQACYKAHGGSIERLQGSGDYPYVGDDGLIYLM